MDNNLVIKNQPVLSKIFNKIRKTNNNVQAYMLVGEDKEKIEEYAILLSKILICPHVYEENCNKCNICKRINENNYGELKIIKPINRIIKKESIIELRDYFRTESIEGKNEVYIINDAETLNIAAANSILKFLEEPDSNAVAIFTTTNLDSVIKTITSRCQLIKTNNVRTKYGIDFVKELTNLEEDQIYDIIDFTKSLERNYNKAFSCVKTNIVDVYNNKELLSSALKVMLLYYKDMLNYNTNTSYLLE